ncbi:NAD(P)/FAD-dependent oxidoreductase [candidate division NPL-UPA2 bacterium Unc8]|uniref:UDP-galactopyranose mutase n=2 Tax=Bacteria TaxID=2 RepID=A0A9E2BGG6_PSYF1|nr:UDP-galactopyranose mutase [Bacillota bacterium]MBT9145145.1 UDP-galactopyranose mutase [Candidatus Psychracetigena formicireducens]MBT9146288.1 UDP-galactopyranose mutase [Bacillota bacterium]RII00716.1 MAG: NAD(P)/FAD-dependent oxidoreductase [candidate division NPL-UPA2 bacterium Unc8]
MYDHIIVGSGINGLLLGTMLAHDGKKVLILEKAPRIGGRAFLWEKDGFIVDYGVHLVRFGPHSSLAKVMNHIGEKIEFVKLGKSFVVDQDGERKIFPTKPVDFVKTNLFSFKEKLSAIKVMLKIKKGKINFDDYMGKSLREWLEEMKISGGLGRYFHLVSASMMVCPFIEKVSVGEMLHNMEKVARLGHSAEYPKGGWKPIYEIITRTIARNGEIKSDSSVDSVIIEKRRAVGVKVGKTTYNAKSVIINIPAQEMFSVLSEDLFESEYMKMCKNLLPTSGVFIDIGLKEHISDLSGLLYTYDPKTFGLITSNLETSVAPQGKQLLTWFFPTTLEDMEDSAAAGKRENELWKAIRMYFPDIEKYIEWRRVSKLRVIDGVQVNTEQTIEARPTSEVPGIKNLFLVGDSIAAPGAGGDVGSESIELTYKAIEKAA